MASIEPIQWGKTKFRASSWGDLMTEPRSKKDGQLSKTCQKELIKIYNLVKYKRTKQIKTREVIKGVIAEPASIALYGRVQGKVYFKNEIKLENDWATGHPDIFSGETIYTATEIDDIKTSWEIDTFMPKLVEEVDPGYDSQLQVYFDLVPTAKSGSIVYCLVSAPDELIQDELKRLQFDLNIPWESDPTYQAAAREIIRHMTFDDIPDPECVIKQPVERNEATIQAMRDKVPLLRDWLQWFENKHLKRNPLISIGQ
jgi:hypothetical protein